MPTMACDDRQIGLQGDHPGDAVDTCRIRVRELGRERPQRLVRTAIVGVPVGISHEHPTADPLAAMMLLHVLYLGVVCHDGQLLAANLVANGVPDCARLPTQSWAPSLHPSDRADRRHFNAASELLGLFTSLAQRCCTAVDGAELRGLYRICSPT